MIIGKKPFKEGKIELKLRRNINKNIVFIKNLFIFFLLLKFYEFNFDKKWSISLASICAVEKEIDCETIKSK